MSFRRGASNRLMHVLEYLGYQQSEREPMQFKVGDRVEAIKPPINLEKSDPDEVGIGVIKEVNPRPFDGAYLVKLDSGPEWAYWESYLRPAPTATPTPSITVGTQVRLTGVVIEPTQVGDPNVWVEVIGGFERNAAVFVGRQHVEVIRQPFKRGEVVYYVGDKDSEPRTVVTDEKEGFVLLARHVHGTETLEWDATSFERRP